MRRFVASQLVVLVAAGVLTACGDDGDSSDEAILLGSVFNTSGFQAVLDVPSSRGAALAAAEINGDGGVLGRDLELVAVEGDSDPETLASGVAAMLDDEPEVVAFLGLSDTDMVLGAAPVAAAAGRVFLSSGATSPRLPGQVSESLFLACFGDNVQAAAGAEWAFETLGASAAAVLYDPAQTYTDLLQGYFVDRFSGLGGTVNRRHCLRPAGR